MKYTLSSCSLHNLQSKRKLHGIFSTTPFTPQGSFKQRFKRNSNRARIQTSICELFDQDVQTFTGIMYLNVDQLEKPVDKEEFQEIGSMDAFRVLKTRFHTFINSWFSSDDDDGQMTGKALHKREYDSRVNERQMQTKEGKVDTCKALDASLVVIKSSGTEFGKEDTRSKSGNDADFKPVYDEEPMAEDNQDAEQCHDIRPLLAKLIDNKTTENEHLNKENKTLKKHYKELYDSIKATRTKTIEQTTYLITHNAEFKAQLQEKGFAITALKNELRKLTGNNVNTKFAKPSIFGKPILHPLRNQSVVRQSNAFKSERPTSSKPRFASQVDVKNDLPKPVTTHYLPKRKESAFAKPHHMIAPGSSRYSSNDMVHNHYLEEAKKNTQERGMNSRPSVMSYATSQSTTNGSKPKPRINDQKSRN
ncbi:hypothetical protein Tco_0443313 [Tanacetum coccineum]